MSNSVPSSDSQVLVPHEVFVGDTAELSYSFYSGIDFLSGSSTMQLDITRIQPESESDVCTIKKAVLSKNENGYTVTFTIIPWRTGTIDFPPFDLVSVLVPGKSGFMVDPKPFTVASLAEKTNSTTLRPPSPPVLIPGTTYIVYGSVVLLIGALVILVRVLMNMQGIVDAWNRMVQRIGYSRNAKQTLKKLKILAQSGKTLDDRAFCEQLENTERKYLEYRFGYPFTSLTSDRFEQVFETLTGGTMSLAQSLRIEELGSMLRRADYIRFAYGSLDAEKIPVNKYAAVLGDNERDALIATAEGAVHFFEKEEKDSDA